MEQNASSDINETREMLMLVGGAAFLVLGAGLIITHPAVRRAVAAGVSAVLPDVQAKLGPGLSAIAPDISRYMKLRSM